MNKPTYIDFYNQLEKIHTENGGKVGLQSDKEQSEFHRKIFHILTALVNVGNSTIHDAGCGYGDILKTLRFEKDKYIGTDSRQNVIDEATKTYKDYKFSVCDLTKTKAPDADITIAIGTTAFLTKSDAVKVFTNIEASTSRAVVFTCWGSFGSITDGLKKESKLMYEWLKKRADSGEGKFSNSAMLTADKHGEAIFFFFNE